MVLGMDLRIFRLTRAGGIDTNPTTFTQRAGTFASAVAQNGAATLLTRREATGLHGYVILDGKTVAANAPVQLAHTVGARAEETELPTDLADSPAIGRLVFKNSPALRETQSGIDPTELPRILANVLPADSWVAVSMRAPSNKERKHYTPWLANRLGTATPVHHSTSPAAMVISITAGGSSEDEVRSVLAQVTAGLPGFDLDSAVTFPATRHRAAVGAFIAPVPAAAALIGVPFIPAEVTSLAPAVFAFLTPVLLGLAVIAGVLAAGAFTGKLVAPDTKLRTALKTAAFPEPATRRGKPNPPRKEQTVKRQASNGQSYEKRIAASDGDYPLAQDAFLVGPNVVVGMVSPHAGAISGEAATRARATPPGLLQDIGPMLGSNDDGSPHLSAAALLFGTAIVGQPGSGKSLLVRSLFGWHCMERVHPSGRPGYPGKNNTLIAFESKGDGVAKYVTWARTLGDQVLVIDAADPSTPAIDMFAVPGDNGMKSSFFVNAMRYTFGKEAIGDRSFETLTGVFTAALAIDQALLDSMEDRDERAIQSGRSPIYYAYLLLGGRGDAIGVELAAAIKSFAVKMRERGTAHAVMEQAYEAIASLYEGRTESARRPFLEAPRNKVSAMLDLESWWSPARRKVTWSQVLEGHRSIVINTGSSPTGAVLEENQNQMISSMLMFSLKNAMVRHCSGWLELGRSVTVFADELSLLAGTSPEIIGWIRDQGRSYGIRAILATQRPEQLGAALRNNFLTYTTLISFAQTDVTTAGEVASNVGAGEWTADDIQYLEPYHVVVRTSVDQRRQSAFIVKLPNFEANIPAYPIAQGYARPVTAGAAPSPR